ncbi:hypothetical protein AAFC00_005632 [Neodothiora populina]
MITASSFLFLTCASLLATAAGSHTNCEAITSSGVVAVSEYVSWSLDHIHTWCKDHDPSAKNQCASFAWPSDVAMPKYKKFRRNIIEWLLTVRPNIGTRPDCITRSAALGINTTSNGAGLVEAVTCDLYDFGKHRHEECVCFPVYADHIVTEYVIHNDVRTLHTTTSVFYPPEQVMQSVLLAAAEEGPPFGKAAKVMQREPRQNGCFPYCPLPGSVPKADVVRRTAVETITKTAKHGSKTTMTTTYPPVPTTTPDCNDVTFYAKRKASACGIDICMWDFIKNYTSTVSDWVTFSDARGNALRADWNTTFFLVTTTHWGTFPPFSDPSEMSSAKRTDPWSHGMVGSYSRYLTSIGLPPPKDEGQKVLGMKVKEVKAACHNETDCWRYCEKRQKKAKTQLLQLMGFATVITTIALLGMAWTLSAKWRKETWDGQSPKWMKKGGGGPQDPAPAEAVETEAGNGHERGATQVQAQDGNAGAVGTMGKAAEEGRGRPRVRFFPDDQIASAHGENGAGNGVRRVSGRNALFEVSERGSIRSRVPSLADQAGQ